MEILIHCVSSIIMEILIYCTSSSTLEILIYCILYVAMTTHVTFCISCLFMAIVLLCIRDCSMYLQSYAEIYYCTDKWLVLPPRSSLLHFWDGFYNVFWPSYYPSDLTHQGGHLLQLILPHMVDHMFMAFLIPLQTLQNKWNDIIL